MRLGILVLVAAAGVVPAGWAGNSLTVGSAASYAPVVAGASIAAQIAAVAPGLFAGQVTAVQDLRGVGSAQFPSAERVAGAGADPLSAVRAGARRMNPLVTPPAAPAGFPLQLIPGY